MDLEADGSTSRELSLHNYHIDDDDDDDNDNDNNNKAAALSDSGADDDLKKRNGTCRHDNGDDAVFNSDGNPPLLADDESRSSSSSSSHRIESPGLGYHDDKHGNGELLQVDTGFVHESEHSGSGEFTGPSLPTTGKEADYGESKAIVSPGPGMLVASPPRNARTGVGLKKWRRIKRENLKDGSPSTSYDKNLKRGLNGPAKGSSVPLAEMVKEESRGSFSSANATINDAGGLVGLPVSGLGFESPAFSAGTDSNNSENRSSKSSTAASAPKFRSKHQGGRNAGSVGPRMQQGKGLVHTGEKPRGRSAVIEKGNTFSGPESDSRSSESVNSTARQRRRAANYDQEQGDDTLVSGGQSVEEVFATLSESVGEADDISLGDAQSPWMARRRNQQYIRSLDPLVDSVAMLQSAQEALEREIGKFGEIDTDLNFLGEESSNVPDIEIQLEEAKGLLKEKEMKIASLEAVADSSHKDLGGTTIELQQAHEIEAELEDLFKKRIEAEIEHLAIRRATETWIVLAKNQIKIFDEQRSLFEEQKQTARTIRDAERKAATLKSQVEEFEAHCYQDILGVEDVFNMQKKVTKTTACFLLQLFLLILVLGLFFLRLSPDSAEVVPIPT